MSDPISKEPPRTLYVRRPLLNADEVIAWAKSQGFKTTLPAEEMHVTLIHSRLPVDWFKFPAFLDDFGVGEGGPRAVLRLGDDGAVVLRFACPFLEDRQKEFVAGGASHDYSEYRPHVTISYSAEGVDLESIEPFQGDLRFGPEKFTEIQDDWRDGLIEKNSVLGSLQSIRLQKAAFDNADAMRAFLRERDISVEKACDLGDSVLFTQMEVHPDTALVDRKTDIATMYFTKAHSFEVLAQIRKESIDEAEMTCEGIVYEPYAVDAHGDWADPATIKQAAYDFLENAKTQNVDVQHSFQKAPAAVVESFIAKANDPHYREGSWVVKVKVHCQELWAKILKGEYTAFSMAGTGSRCYYEEHENDGFVQFAKESHAEDGKRFKGRTRLTELKVDWISIVDSGANMSPYKFLKSANPPGIQIWKSRDQRIRDGDVPMTIDQNFLTRLETLFKKFLGGNPSPRTWIPEPPAPPAFDTGKEGVNMDPRLISLLGVATNLAGRLACNERLVKSLMATQAGQEILRQNPQLAEIVQKMNPTDLEHFAKQGEMLQQVGNNGVNLPAPQNFFGYGIMERDINSFISGGGKFPGGDMSLTTMEGASYGVPSADISTLKGELMKQIETLQAKIAGLEAGAVHTDQIKNLAEQMMGGFARMDALQKSLLESGTSESTPVPNSQGSEGGGQFSASVPGPVDVLKGLNPLSLDKGLERSRLEKIAEESPFTSDPVAIFGGIQHSGTGWLK